MEYLSKQLAPCITRHGVLLDIYGEGVMITGDSGVGKSESAIELIMRGHRLVADDAVEIRLVAEMCIRDSLHTFHIGFPSPIGTPMRVRDLNAERNALIAELALCHRCV